MDSRTIEVFGGPRDGASFHVATLMDMPRRLVFVIGMPSRPVRHAYTLIERSEGFSAYQYEGIDGPLGDA